MDDKEKLKRLLGAIADVIESDLRELWPHPYSAATRRWPMDEPLHGPWSGKPGLAKLRVMDSPEGPVLEAEHKGEFRVVDTPVGRVCAREIARLAAENSALQLTVGEGHEIEGEFLGALAMLTEEELTPCVNGCHGHLGNKAGAMIREAREAWTKLEAENYELKSRLNESLEESESWRDSYKKHCEGTAWIALENERLKDELKTAASIADTARPEMGRMVDEIERLKDQVEAELQGQVDISEGAGRMKDRYEERLAKMEIERGRLSFASIEKELAEWVDPFPCDDLSRPEGGE